MELIDHVENLRKKVVAHGEYRRVALESGLTYHWLHKFAIGAIENPGIKNVARLDQFFKR